MRIIINNADFSSVSIGKVEKDLSFSYIGQEAIAAKLLNPPYSITSTRIFAGPDINDRVDYPRASSGDQDYTMATNNPNRFITDFIPVKGGMVLTYLCENTENVPVVTCYDSSQNILTPPDTYSSWSTDTNVHTFTVPSGVAYVKFCMSSLQTGSELIGV